MSEVVAIYNCPFCEEHKGTPDTKGHFYYYGPENGYHCFRCGEYRSKGSLPEVLEGEVMLGQEIAEAYKGRLDQSPAYYLRHARDAWKYLTARSYLDKRGISEKVTKASNLLYATRGDYAQRIIFPVFDYRVMADSERDWRSATVYFVARSIVGAEPKYLNCPTGKNGWVYLVAGRNDEAPFPTLVVVEGVFDAFSAARTDFPTAAIFGKRINSAQCKHIAQIAKRCVVLLDNDAFASSLEVSYRLSYYLPTVRAELPPKMDPDKLVRNHGAFALKGIVERAMRVWDEEETPEVEAED